MDCKIKVKGWENLLDKTEFKSYEDFINTINSLIGKDVQYKKGKNTYVGKVKAIASNLDVIVEVGIGKTKVEQYKKPSALSLTELEGSEINEQTNEVTPEFEQDYQDPEPPIEEFEEDPTVEDYNPQLVKWEQYQSTTTQDLISEKESKVIPFKERTDFKDDALNYRQRSLLSLLKEDPGSYTLVGIQDDETITPGQEQYGQVLVVVANPLLGKVKDKKSALENAVKINGEHTPFSFEGSLVGPSRTFFGETEGADRTKETHDERVRVRHKFLVEQGLDVSLLDVAQMFENEFQELQADRQEIEKGKIKFYSVKKVSEGHFKPSDKNLLELATEDLIYRPRKLMLHYSGKRKGQISGEINGEDTQLLPRRISPAELEVLSGLAGKSLTEQEALLVNTLLGSSKKGYQVINNKIYYKSKLASQEDLEGDLLTRRVVIQSSWVKQYNDSPNNNITIAEVVADPSQATGYRIDEKSAVIETFVLSNLSSGFEFYKSQGRIDPTPANRYIYFEKSPDPEQDLTTDPDVTNFNPKSFREKLEPWMEDVKIQEVEEGYKIFEEGGLTITIGNLPGMMPGVYRPSQNKIYLVKGVSEDIRLEEALHATTGQLYKNLDAKDPRRKNLEKLLAKARRHFNKSSVQDNIQIYYSLYGKTEGKPRNKQEALRAQLEFLARGLTDPDTRLFLQSIENRNSNLYLNLLEAVQKLLQYFNITLPNSVFGELLNINMDLLTEVRVDDLAETQPQVIETSEEDFKDGEDFFEEEDDLFGDIIEDFDLGSIPNLTTQDKKEIAQTLDYFFVNMNYKNKNTIYDILNADSKKLPKVINSMGAALQKLRDKLKGNKDKTSLVNFLSAYVSPKTHLEMKRAWLENSVLFNAEFVEDVDDMIKEMKEGGEKSGRDFSFDGNEINHLKFSNSTTKALLQTIEKVVDGKKVYTKYGVNELADFKQLFYKTLKLTQGSSSINEMLDRLSQSEDKELNRIVDRLPVYPDNDGWHITPSPRDKDPDKVSNEQLVLSFFQDMRKPDLDYFTLKRFEDGDGSKYEWILELNSKTTKIKEKFFTNLRKIARDSNYYEIDSNNQPKAKLEIIPQAKKLLDKNDWEGFFDLMGINFSDKTYKDKDFQSELKELSGLRRQLLNHLTTIVNVGLTDPYRQLSNDFKKSKGFFARLSTLVKIESKYSPVTANYSLRNAAGNLVQGNTIPNTFTFLSQEVNKLSIEEFNNLQSVQKGDPDYAKKRLLGNVFSTLFQHSRTKQKLFGLRKRNLQFLSYGGMSDQDAKVTSDLSQSDWVKMQINTMLKVGTNEIMRPETLTSGWAWKVEGMNKGELWVTSKADFFNQLKEYLKGELKRINLSRELPDFKYYNKELSLFKGLLELDLSRIEGMNSTEVDLFVDENFSEFKPQLEQWFENEYLELQEHTTNLRADDIDLGIRNKYNDNAALILEHFLMNDIIYNIETSILFYGGVEWYKDFHKRAKGILSTGQIPPMDNTYWQTRTRDNTLTGLHGHTNHFDWKIKTAILKEDEAKSLFVDQIRKGAEDSLHKRLTRLGEKVSKAEVKEKLQKKIDNYNFMEIGDGQGWCTLDFYREFLQSVGNWNKDLEAWYKSEVAYYKKYERGMELTPQEEEYLNSKPKTNSTSLKVSYYGTTDAFDQINPQIFDKFSLTPIIPSAVRGKKLSELNKRMLESDIGYVKMQSGTKVAQRREGDGPMSPAPFFDSQRNLIVPDLDNYSYEIYLPYLKEQLKTDGKVKKKTITSTQKRKLLVSDLQEMGVWIDLDWTPTQVAKFHNMSTQKFSKFPKAKRLDLVRQYQDTLEPTPLAKLYGDYLSTIEQKTELLKLELFEDLGMEQQGDNILIKSSKFFLEQLKSELSTRDLNDAVKDFIDLKTRNEDIPFEVSTNKQSLQNLIQGLINKRLVRQKLNGSQLIQVAPTGYEELGSTIELRQQEKTGSTGLKFYTLKDGVTQAAETKVGLVGKWKPLLNRKDVADRAEEKGITKLEALNELIKDSNWLKDNHRLITYTGERIPVQGINSMEYFMVEEFLPGSVGPIIIPPAELVVKSGGDYDIDKETVQIPVLDDNGELVTSADKFTVEDAKELTRIRSAKEQLQKDIDKIPSVRLKEKFARIDYLNNQYREHFKQFGSDPVAWELIQNEISNIEQDIENTIKDNQEFFDFKDMLFRVNREYLRLEDKKFRHFALLDNNLLDVTSKIMSHELNYHQLVTPISTDYIAPPLRKIGENLHGAQEDPQNSEIIKTTTNIKKRKSLLTNPRLLGIVAVSNTYLQQYILVNAKINRFYSGGEVLPRLLTPQEREQIEFEGKWYVGNQLDFNGRMKSELGSQHINATVDGAKEDYLGDANYSMSNMGMIMYLQLFGVPIERVGNFINQPVIYELNRFAEMSEELRISALGDPSLKFLSKRDAVVTQLFRAMTGIEGNLKDIRYELRRKKTLTPTEEKILESFNSKKRLKFDSELEQIWGRDLNLDTPNFEAKNSNEEMLKDPELQMSVLTHYLSLNRQAGALFNIQSRHNYDTSTSQSPIHARERSILEETITKEKLMDAETLRRLKTKTPTKSFNIQSIIEDVYAQVFQFNYPTEFITQVLDAPIKNKTTALKERYYRTVSNDLIEWILKRRVKVNGQQYGPYVNDLLEIFSKEYLEFIDKNPQVQDLKIIKDLLLKPVGKRTYFHLLQDSRSTVEQNIYIENIETLNSIDPEFTKKLVLLGFGQTGFNKTYFSWGELIPPSLLVDILIPAFKSPITTEEINQFMREFQFNNPIFFKKSAKKPNMEVKYTQEKKFSENNTYRGLLNATNLPYNGVFVFGSNPIGVNGNPKKGTGGAALVANQQFGVQSGEKMDNKMSSSGRAYGLVTVTRPGRRKSKTLDQIRENVEILFEEALNNPDKKYYIAYSGKNPSQVSLNGYSAQEMANQFYGYPDNLVFEENFIELIPEAPEVLSDTPRRTSSLLTERTLVFRGKTVQDAELITNTGEVGGAKTDYKKNIIRVSYDRLWSIYNNKGWTNPRVQVDGSNVTPLPAEQFQSYREWLTFVILHEYKHFDYKKLPEETQGQYEDRINQLALEDLYENFDTYSEAIHPAAHYRFNAPEEKRLAVAQLIARSKQFEIQGQDQESHYYDNETGKRFERATHYINKRKPEPSPLLESSQLIGTAIDQMTRDYFSGTLKPYEEYKIPQGRWVKPGLLFESKELYKKFVSELDKLNNWFKQNGEQVIAEDVVVFDENIPSEYEGVAGTVDLLTIDNEGRVRLYDLKSKRSGVDFKHSQKYGKSDFEKWTDQLNLYRILMANTNKLLANELGILPIKVNYAEGGTSTNQAFFLDLEVIPILKNVRGAKVNTNMQQKAKTPQSNAPLGSIPKDFEVSDYMLGDEAEFVSFEEDGYLYEVVPITERIDFFTAIQNNIKVKEFNGRKVIHEVRRQRIVKPKPKTEGDSLKVNGLEPLIINEKDKDC